MCGRITQKSPPNQLGLSVVSLIEPLHVPPRFNGAPGQEQWVIRQHPKTGERTLDRLWWGLIPHWCKDADGGRKPINAKAETVASLPTFRDAYRRRRCLVPIDSLGRSSVGQLAASYLTLLPAYAAKLEAGHELIAEQALDLIALSFGAAAQESVGTVSSSRTLHLLRLRSAIEARLDDTTLTPDTAAAAAQISVRFANALLAEQRTSLARYIQDLRLERCRKILLRAGAAGSAAGPGLQ